MRALDSLTWHTMDAMADDWESIEQIRPHVAQFCGVASDDRIFQALRQLHADHLVRIIEPDGAETSAFPDQPEAYWFSMTEAGRQLWDREGSRYRDEHQKA